MPFSCGGRRYQALSDLGAAVGQVVFDSSLRCRLFSRLLSASPTDPCNDSRKLELRTAADRTAPLPRGSSSDSPSFEVFNGRAEFPPPLYRSFPPSRGLVIYTRFPPPRFVGPIYFPLFFFPSRAPGHSPTSLSARSTGLCSTLTPVPFLVPSQRLPLDWK